MRAAGLPAPERSYDVNERCLRLKKRILSRIVHSEDEAMLRVVDLLLERSEHADETSPPAAVQAILGDVSLALRGRTSTN